MSNDYSDISNYEMIKTLGEGNFGKVKLAEFKSTKEEFAIKIMSKRQIKIKMKNTVFREIEIVSKLIHINIANVFEIIDDIEYYYIIMEFCHGGELFDYISSKRKLDELEASLFFYQLINCLEYIHSQKICHRDLKLENLLLTKGKLLKIIDFGLSHEFDGKNLLKTKCGSPSYASPEIVRGEKYDGFKVDIWCCGIILYAMVCGFLPFDTEFENNKSLFKKILLCDPEIPKGLSEDVKILIKSMLTSDPKNRISIEEIKKNNFYFKGKKICDLTFDCLLTEYYLNKKELDAKETKNYFYRRESHSINNSNRREKRSYFKDIEYNNENKYYIDTNGNNQSKDSNKVLSIIGKNHIFYKSKKNNKKSLNYSYKFEKIGENLKKILNINKIIESNNNDNSIYNDSSINENIKNTETKNPNKLDVHKKRLMRLIEPINSNKFLITNSSPKRSNNLLFNKRNNFRINDKTISVDKNGIYKLINRNNDLNSMNIEKNETLDYNNRLTIQNNINCNNYYYTPMRSNIVSIKKNFKKTPDHPPKLMLNNINININTENKNINTSINKTILNSLGINKKKNGKVTYLSIDKSTFKNINLNSMNNNETVDKVNIPSTIEKNNVKKNNNCLDAIIYLNNQDKIKFKNKFLIKDNAFENDFLLEIKTPKIDKIFPVTYRKKIQEISSIKNMRLNNKRDNILPLIRINKDI